VHSSHPITTARSRVKSKPTNLNLLLVTYKSKTSDFMKKNPLRNGNPWDPLPVEIEVLGSEIDIL
jgi:hypothetical protein